MTDLSLPLSNHFTLGELLRSETADCQLSPRFLTDPAARATREQIADMVQQRVAKPMRMDLNASLYLFAFVCLSLSELDIDQVIHEYGEDLGKPAWVHIAASERKDKRQILLVGRYTNKSYLSTSTDDALLRTCT